MATIDENWNIVDVTRAFCQKVLPLVYDESLSYMEMICKMSSKLNEVIENNNNLPQYVKELIKEIVDSDELTQIVGSVLMDTIINVKFPPEGISPAKGDGIADDTQSIQACLDYANDKNMCVFFPPGNYLTNSLQISSKVSIVGSDRYTTIISLKGGNNNLFSVLNSLSVRNVTLNGNNINQIGEVEIILGNLNNCLLDNLIVENCASFINGTCNNVQFSNIHDYSLKQTVVNGNNNIISGYLSKNKPLMNGNFNINESAKEYLVFESLEKVDEGLETGTFIKVLNVNEIEGLFKVEDETTNDARSFSYGDKYLVVQYEDYLNVLLVAPEKTDISSKIQSLLDNGVPLYFPSGIYDFHVIVKTAINIKGDGMSTIFKPSAKNADNSIFKMECDGNKLSHSKMYSFYTICNRDVIGEANFIHTVSKNSSINDFFDFFHMSDIRIENYTTALVVNSRMIWGSFNNVWFYGSFYAGVFISSQYPVNLNSFYHCAFNNNVEFAYYNDNTEINSLLNNFVDCNFENNKQALGGVNPTTLNEGSLYFGLGETNLVNCYIENNTILPDTIVISNYGKTNFSGCSFILEQNLIKNNSIANFVNCFSYQAKNNIVDTVTQFIENKSTTLVNCNFKAENNNDLNNLQFIPYSQEATAINLKISKIILLNQAIDSLLFGTENSLYFLLPTVDTFIVSSLTGTGEQISLKANCLYPVLYKNNKLYFINSSAV